MNSLACDCQLERMFVVMLRHWLAAMLAKLGDHPALPCLTPSHQ